MVAASPDTKSAIPIDIVKYTPLKLLLSGLAPACLCQSVRCRTVAAQFVGNLVYRQRLAEVVALNLVTLMSPQECHLRFVFDAFGNHLEIEAFCHADDCGCDRHVIRIHGDIADKRTVDFELADRELSQVAEAGIARPEVVNR